MKSHKHLLIAAILLLISSAASADVVWPALYLEVRLFSWWAIGIGLAAEYFFVQRLFQLSPWPAAKATFAANAVSAALGIVLIPLSGIAWELFPASIYNGLLRWGTFNPITWCATFVLACFINTAIEWLIYKKAFKFEARQREFWWLLVANSVSVGIAFITLFISPVEA